MPDDPILDEERVVMMRVALAVLRLTYDRTEGDVTMGMIRLAIRLAQKEGRPVDVSALSAITGIPRATIHRKLGQYNVSVHRLGRRRVPTLEDEPSIEGDRTFTAFRAILLNACKQLGLLSVWQTLSNDVSISDTFALAASVALA